MIFISEREIIRGNDILISTDDSQSKYWPWSNPIEPFEIINETRHRSWPEKSNIPPVCRLPIQFHRLFVKAAHRHHFLSQKWRFPFGVIFVCIRLCKMCLFAPDRIEIGLPLGIPSPSSRRFRKQIFGIVFNNRSHTVIADWCTRHSQLDGAPRAQLWSTSIAFLFNDFVEVSALSRQMQNEYHKQTFSHFRSTMLACCHTARLRSSNALKSKYAKRMKTNTSRRVPGEFARSELMLMRLTEKPIHRDVPAYNYGLSNENNKIGKLLKMSCHKFFE